MDYSPNHEARNRKRAELISDCQEILGPELSMHAEQAIDSFCSMSPPLDPPIVIEMITLSSAGRRGGQTRKPGNIILNWRNLLRESPDLVLTGAGVATTPWLIPLAALSIFNKLWTNSKIDLTREHASCLFAMWQHCNDDHKLATNLALAECQELFKVFGWPPLNAAQFSAILHDLVELQCIELPDQATIWMRERVKTQYS